MSTDIFGEISLVQLERAVRLAPEDENYNSMLFFRYLQQAMLKLARTGFVDYHEIRKALSLFQIELVSPSHQKTAHQAVIDRKENSISWRIDFTKKGLYIGVSEYITVTPGGKCSEKRKYKTHTKINNSKQKPFGKLSPELQEKIKKRNKNSF